MSSCFKAYDIRGRVRDLMKDNLPYLLGRALALGEKPRSVVMGRDVRPSGPLIQNALAAGLREYGVKVLDAGLCTTEEIYFAAAEADVDLGIMITGSHNPADENGCKIVRKGAIPISSDSGLRALEKRVLEETGKIRGPQASTHDMQPFSLRDEYIRALLSFLDPAEKARGLGRQRRKILIDAGNGSAGPVLKKLLPHLPWDIIPLDSEPDGSFPNGVPNPLLPEKRGKTAEAVRKNGCDIGIAFDGDADRCFFYDGDGTFIESYYLIGVLAGELLLRHPGATILHDTRVYWNTVETVLAAGGVPCMTRTGHAFMKERMRAENALYGGEMSAHHYFRDFSFCDSGMIPWLLLLSMLDRSGKSLGEYVDERIRAYPCSGEINSVSENTEEVLAALRAAYGKKALRTDTIDGLNMEFETWRFNVRRSNTEPLLRLNLESRGDRALLNEKKEELLTLFAQCGAKPANAEEQPSHA